MPLPNFLTDFNIDSNGYCLVDNFYTANKVKKSFTGTQQLPKIVVLSNLLNAAALLPDNNAAAIIDLAAMGDIEKPFDTKMPMVWTIYLELNNASQYIDANKRKNHWQMANQIVETFTEIDNNHPPLPSPLNNNPFTSDNAAASPSYEMQLTALLWEELAKKEALLPKQLSLQKLTQQLQSNLPDIIVYLANANASEEHFYLNLCRDRCLKLEDANDEHLSNAEKSPLICWQGQGQTNGEAAQMALQTIFKLLDETSDNSNIGIVVYDRLLARRLDALAKNEGIEIQDNMGWRAETLSYGSALLNFLELSFAPFDLNLITRCLSSPYFGQNKRSPNAEQEWQQFLSNSLNLPTQTDDLLNLNWHSPDLAKKLTHFHQLKNNFSKRQSLDKWVEWLFTRSKTLLATWCDDAIAKKVENAILKKVAGSGEVIDGFDFYQFIRHVLSTENIPENEIKSNVSFVPPNYYASFDAVILLGFNDSQQKNTADKWLSEKEREALNMNTAKKTRQAQEEYLQFCQDNYKIVSAIWAETSSAGQVHAPHPLWQQLAQTAAQAGRLVVLTEPDNDVSVEQFLPPQAQATVDFLPSRLSISAAKDLMICPYKFYVQQFLNLSESEEGDIYSLSPLLKGKMLHQLLEKFVHQIQPLKQTASEPLSDITTLQNIWQQLIKDTLNGNRPELATYRLYWHQSGQDYILWEMERAAEQFLIYETEYKIEMEWHSKKNKAVTLAGRIDRIDYHQAAELYSVIDYKTSLPNSQKQINRGENPQLALYAFLLEQQLKTKVDKKMYVMPLETNKQLCKMDQSDTTKIIAGLRRVLNAIENKVPMPANGVATHCQYCSLMGVCRRQQRQ